MNQIHSEVFLNPHVQDLKEAAEMIFNDSERKALIPLAKGDAQSLAEQVGVLLAV